MVTKILRLWSGDEARQRSQWEDKVTVTCQDRGFLRVYTPYVYKHDVKQTFIHWTQGAFHLRPTWEADDPDKSRDCAHYEYVGHKGLCHIPILGDGLPTYSSLPLRLFEHAEIYDQAVQETGGLLSSRPCSIRMTPGVYLSVMCDPTDLDTEAGRVYATLMTLSLLGASLGDYSIRPGVVAPEHLYYVARSGKKEGTGLILARARFNF